MFNEPSYSQVMIRRHLRTVVVIQPWTPCGGFTSRGCGASEPTHLLTDAYPRTPSSCICAEATSHLPCTFVIRLVCLKVDKKFTFSNQRFGSLVMFNIFTIKDFDRL